MVPVVHEVTQTPAVQTCPAAQVRAQAPQFKRSVVRSRQVPEQLVRPVAHDTVQALREHT